MTKRFLFPLVLLIRTNIIFGTLIEEVDQILSTYPIPNVSHWGVDATHDLAGGVHRVSGDGPKLNVYADPSVEIGTRPSVTLEQVVTHPNFELLPPFTECGYSDEPNIDTKNDGNHAHETNGARPKRIVGGKPVHQLSHPWMVQLYLYNFSSNTHSFHCAGTIISNVTILTAAHCLTRVRSGTTLNPIVLGNLEKKAIKFCQTQDPHENCSREFFKEIDDIEVHNGYSEGDLNNDIALIYLKTPIKFSPRVRPICLPYSYRLLENWSDVKLTGLGWGSTSQYYSPSIQSTDVLKAVKVDLQPRALCDKFHTRMYGKTLDSRFCVGGNTGSGLCNGDSGGGIVKTVDLPLFGVRNRYVQFGVTSAGGHVTYTCGFQGRPVPVVNVLYYMNWILNHVAPGVHSYVYVKSGVFYKGVKMEGTWVQLNKTENRFYLQVFKSSYAPVVKPKNEFSTGNRIDVSQHPNIRLLPSYKYCGSMNEQEDKTLREDKDTNDKVAPAPAIVNVHTSSTIRPPFYTSPLPIKPENAPSSDRKRVKRIVGGTPTNLEGYYPWMVQIRVRNVETDETSLRCSGTIISHEYVITAAHCITDITIPFVFDSVVLGQYNRNSTQECIDSTCYNPIFRKVQDMIIHENYEKFTYVNNIALLRLSEPLKFNRMVQPICLPLKETFTDGLVNPNYYAAGWGKIGHEELIISDNSRNSLFSTILLETKAKILPRADCDFLYSRTISYLDRSRFCGGGITGHGECSGDAGGPLMKKLETEPNHILYGKFFQLGIIAFTDCGIEGMPTVYMNIIYYMNWILDNMQSSSEKLQIIKDIL